MTRQAAGPVAADAPTQAGGPGTVVPAGRMRLLAARIAAATPAERDRAVDALRALAITGVIAGHWLVTALVASPGRGGPRLHDASPLAAQPMLDPLSWLFQTLRSSSLLAGTRRPAATTAATGPGCANA